MRVCCHYDTLWPSTCCVHAFHVQLTCSLLFRRCACSRSCLARARASSTTLADSAIAGRASSAELTRASSAAAALSSRARTCHSHMHRAVTWQKAEDSCDAMEQAPGSSLDTSRRPTCDPAAMGVSKALGRLLSLFSCDTNPISDSACMQTDSLKAAQTLCVCVWNSSRSQHCN